MSVVRLTQTQVPDNSLIGVFNDVHIPYEDKNALGLAVDACEWAGVTHVVANGDILDCGVVSRHPNKRAKDILRWGTLEESIAPGRWFLDWVQTRPAWYLLGNHEAWVESFIESDPGLAGVASPAGLFGLPRPLVFPSTSRLRLGSLNIEHGHGLFPRGSGGLNPGNRVRTMAPDQTTVQGHLHREWVTKWTTEDDRGRRRTHASYGLGHMTLPEHHADYAGNYQNWQAGFGLIRVFWDGPRPKFTVYPVEVHRTKRNRPIFNLFGRTFQ